MSKKLIIILITLVLIIWIRIFYQFNKAISEPVEFVLKKESLVPESSSQYDFRSYQLKLNYSDPFFEAPVNEKLKISANRKINKQKRQLKPPVSIHYQGSFQNMKEQLAIVRFHETDLLLKKNDSLNGMILKGIFKDSLILESKDAKLVLIR